MLASTVVDFSELGEVVLVALIASVGVCTLFALSVLGAARVGERSSGDRVGTLTYAALALMGLAGSVAAVIYGVFALAQK
jgi:hypothetical protein